MDKVGLVLEQFVDAFYGSYSVNVKLHSDIAATVNFQVVAA